MTGAIAIKRSNLVLPTSGYELDREEMCYVEGGDYKISNSNCVAIVGIMFAGTYFSAVGIGVAVMTGLLTKAVVGGYLYGFIGSIAALNPLAAAALSIVGKFLLEVAFSMVLAVAKGKGVKLVTQKIWKWDTKIPTSVELY